MNESPSATASPPAHESQVRRAQRGVVAGYIHQLSERHGHRRRLELEAHPPAAPCAGR